MPSDKVKWVGLWLDGSLSGREHIRMRAVSAARSLNASIAVMHRSWGLLPALVRDLVRSTVLPCADYGVASFLPLPADAFKPLDRVNKSVSRCITGAFRTAALAALEKESALLPAQLRIERTALHGLASYLSLPASHIIRSLIRDAILMPPSHPRYASPLHLVERVPGVRWPPTVPIRGQRIRPRGCLRVMGPNETSAPFDDSLGMEPIVPVYSAPWSSPLPVTTVILLKEDALRTQDVGQGGAAVRVEAGKLVERLVTPLGEGQVYEGEMEGLLSATRKALGDGHSAILCVADSQATLRGILSTKPRSSQFRAIAYDIMVHDAQFRRPDLAILNLWTPAHIGTAGNELADEAAKDASTLEPDPSLFVSLTTVRRLVHLQALDAWELRWSSSKTGKALRAVDRLPPRLILSPLYSSSFLSRHTISALSQLRTDFSFLNANRAKSGFIPSPACDACGAPYETRAHFLLACPAWEHLRPPLYRASMAAGSFGALYLPTLLNDTLLLKPIAKFVEATGRFL
ncbi:hypothetical protein C8J57DRAFT_1533427 [Mycena rebaudengoi]|nr:hypothetical protein C8J57DRAFT_1533427 [Mycena rebaudengoi]